MASYHDQNGMNISEEDFDQPHQQPYSPGPPPPKSDEPPMGYNIFNHKDIVALLKYKRLLIGAFFIVVVVSACTYAMIKKPTYQTRTLIQIKNAGKSKLSGLAGLTGLGSSGADSSEGTELAMIKSNLVTSLIYQKIVEAKDEKIPSAGLSPGGISGMFSMIKLPGTNLFNIIVQDSIPERATFIANTVVDAYIENKKARNKSESASTTDWIKGRERALKKSIEIAEKKILTVQKEQKVDISFDITNDPMVSITSALNSKVNDLELEEWQLDKKLNLLKGYYQKQDFMGAIQRGIVSPGIIAKQKSLDAKTDDEKELLKSYKSKHPKVIKIITEKQRLQSDLKIEFESLLLQLSDDLADLKIQLSRAVNKLNKMKSVLSDSDLINVRRKLAVDQQMLASMVIKSKEMEVMQSIQSTSVIMLEKATVPSSPIKPQRKKIITISLAIGLLGGIALVILMELLSPTILSEHQLESYTGLPVVKSIGPIVRDEKNDLGGEIFLFKDQDDQRSELFRYIRTSLEYSMTPTSKLVMVTSAEPSEGKSFIALNLSTAIALSGKKTLLLELDLRKPRLSKIMTKFKTPGLHGYFQKGLDLPDCILRTQFGNLDFLLSKRPLINPVEIIGSQKFNYLLTYIKANYDAVIVDTPKIMGLSDSLIIGRYVDFILLVACGGKPLSKFMHILKLFQNLRPKIKGLILNKSIAHEAENYYYYGKYGYKSDYVDDELTNSQPTDGESEIADDFSKDYDLSTELLEDDSSDDFDDLSDELDDKEAS